MDSIYDALRAAIDALGGPKAVGVRMRPEKSQDDARIWLLNCLNADRAERFDPEQVAWLLREARRAGHHDAMHWLADDTGYSHPLPITQAADAERLQRNFIDAVGRQERLFAQMRAAGLNLDGVTP